MTLKVKFDKDVTDRDLRLFYNDSEFVPSEHGDQVSLKLASDEYTIQIRNAQPGRDDGKYKLTSKYDQTECTVSVQVKPISFISELAHCRLKVLPDLFYTKNPELAANYPRDATFECNLSGSCTDVQWYVNDNLVGVDDSRFTASHLLGKSHSLVIANCQLSDTDSTVEIRLGKLNKKSKAQLKVEYISMDQFIKVSGHFFKENPHALPFVFKLL